MFKIDDVVLYGATGVCRIADISEQSFARNDIRKYYVLKPVSAENNTIYAPFDFCDKIRPLIEKDEAKEMLEDVCAEEIELPQYFDKEQCSAIIKGSDRKQLLRLVRQLCAAKKLAVKRGRKFHIGDESLLKNAMNLACDEFSYVLQIKPDDISAKLKA